MTLVIAGQLVGLAFACGLDLYLAVAALGILARLGLIQTLPPGLQGLEGILVITSALALFLVEAVVDKISHADSVWDAVHTFVRPPAAALLAVGALWGQPLLVTLPGVFVAFLVALAAHTFKAGLRLARNATLRTERQTWLSMGEDLLTLALVVAAFLAPVPTLIAVAVVLLIGAPFAPRLWRALTLGIRSLAAWVRSIFVPARWRERAELPRDVDRLVGETPLGGAPPKAARAALTGRPDAGAFRNGWLVLTAAGPIFIFRTLSGTRRVELPAPRDVHVDEGVWAHIVRIGGSEPYTLFMLKDGPPIELTLQQLSYAAP